jgi:hypothetical protein
MALILLVFCAYLTYRAWRDLPHLWPLLWPALSFLLAAAAYAGLGPRLFAKRPSGRLGLFSFILFFPYLLLLYVIYLAHALLTSEPHSHRITPRYHLGRRISARHIPADVTCIVDLTCEFPELSRTIGQRRYVAFPTLDYRAPAPDVLAGAIEQLSQTPGVLYLHCAQGHGRSATLAAGLLIHEGLAQDIPSALQLLKQSRPRVRLNRHQRRALKEALAILQTPASPPAAPAVAAGETRSIA